MATSILNQNTLTFTSDGSAVADNAVITGLKAVPTAATEATSKAYVDQAITDKLNGIEPKEAVDFVSFINAKPANGSLADLKFSNAEATATTNLTAGATYRVLLVNVGGSAQTDTNYDTGAAHADNGVYSVVLDGSRNWTWTRPLDWDPAAEPALQSGSYVAVSRGLDTAHFGAGMAFILTNGTTAGAEIADGHTQKLTLFRSSNLDWDTVDDTTIQLAATDQLMLKSAGHANDASLGFSGSTATTHQALASADGVQPNHLAVKTVTYLKALIASEASGTSGGANANGAFNNITGDAGDHELWVGDAIGAGDTLTVGGGNGTVNVDSAFSVNGSNFTVAHGSGNTQIAGTLGVTSNGSVGGTFGVTGATTLSNTLEVSGDKSTTLGGTLEVTGSATLSSGVNVTGAVNFNSGNFTVATDGATSVGCEFEAGASTLASAEVTNNATVGGTLEVTGNTTLNNNLTVNGNKPTALGGTLGVTGLSTLASAAVTNDATVGGSLGVTGASTLASAAVTNDATVGGTLSVTGNSTLSSVNENSITIDVSAAGAFALQGGKVQIGVIPENQRQSVIDFVAANTTSHDDTNNDNNLQKPTMAKNGISVDL